jgi:hypothetical protein
VGYTIDLSRGQTYITCDGCGARVFGEMRVDPAEGIFPERYSHADPRECQIVRLMRALTPEAQEALMLGLADIVGIAFAAPDPERRTESRA